MLGGNQGGAGGRVHMLQAVRSVLFSVVCFGTNLMGADTAEWLLELGSPWRGFGELRTPAWMIGCNIIFSIWVVICFVL